MLWIHAQASPRLVHVYYQMSFRSCIAARGLLW